jgi:two-component system sensor histidine kinase UhpB
VTVTLERVDEKTVMSLADDGVGFDNRGYPSQGKPTSWGLITIRERAEAIGGQVKIESEPEKGTRIVVEVEG